MEARKEQVVADGVELDIELVKTNTLLPLSLIALRVL